MLICTYLAIKGNVAPATQNQALCAIVFLYKRVLRIELHDTIDSVRAKPSKRVPVVLSINEISKILSNMRGIPKLMASLCYGAGLRKMECHRLRVKDIDLDRNEITVRQGKGNKNRRVPLPQKCEEALRTQLAFVSKLHNRDRLEGLPAVEMPYALAKKV